MEVEVERRRETSSRIDREERDVRKRSRSRSPVRDKKRRSYRRREDSGSRSPIDDRKDRKREGDRHERRRSRSRSRSPSDRRSRRSRRNEDENERNGDSREPDRRKETPNSPKGDSNPPPAAKSSEKREGKTGGVYIPPFKLAMMNKDVTDKSSLEYQKMTWEALKKSINGIINKVSASNIRNLIPELFYENLIRGRGLFCRSLMKAQMASPNFTSVYAALVAVVNTKMPEIGELLIQRIIIAFRKAYRRNNKSICLASTSFLAHLCNQQVVGVIIPLQICALLLEKPTDDSVEVSVSFVTEVGQILQELSPQGFNRIFDRFRTILHEGAIDKRVQYTIELLFAIRKNNFADHPAVPESLDLVDIEDQITHEDLSLDDTFDTKDNLNFFHMDPDFLENEAKYDAIRREVLGEDTIEELEGKEGEEDEEDEEEEREVVPVADKGVIVDATETDLLNLRRTIYLTIVSSVDFNECAHKLLKIKMTGQEMELCNMIIECCSQEKSYVRFYGLLAQRFCLLDKVYQECFDTCFGDQYATIHRLDTNKLRNVAKFFAHLFHSDALPWTSMDYIRLTEEDTTSSSRIFIKFLFQELVEYLGLPKLNERLKDPLMQKSFEGLFPRDNPRNTRFAINFFIEIKLGGITDDLRKHLESMPKIAPVEESSSSESESSSSSSSESSSDSSDSDSDSSSSSDSEDDRKASRRQRRSPSPPPSRRGDHHRRR